jgi:outer membrane protein assembly factor BamE (lipoprotein component of BamABCDE complex)
MNMASNLNPSRSVIVYLLLGILLIACAEFALFLVGCGPTLVPPSGQTAGANKETYTREQFDKLVVGKTQDEVLQAVGKPYLTSQADGVVYWHYMDRTRDPLTKGIDTDVQLIFKNGHVSAVNY